MRAAALTNLAQAPSRLSTSSVVLACSQAWIISVGIATIRPNAVQFMASEMPADSRSDFSVGSAAPSEANAPIRHMTVPSRPSRVYMFENVAR